MYFLSLAFAHPAGAATVNITLDGNYAAPDYAFYTYTDTSGTVHTSIPVAPYMTTLNGGSYNNTPAYTICYDFDSPTNVGTSYAGTFQVLTDVSTMEATYLVNKLNQFGLLNDSTAVRGAISMAIWEIMYPSSTTKSGAFPSDPAAAAYEREAAYAVATHSWTTADSAMYPTWVPANSTLQRLGTVFSGQPVVTFTAVPEPSTYVLIGAGCMVFGFARRRLNRGSSRAEESPASR